MEIILLQDVANLGYKNDIVKVKNGYANNYLIPSGYAVMATAGLRKMNEENIKQQAKKAEKLKKDAEEFSTKLSAITLNVAVKSNASGKMFGTVNSATIAKLLLEEHTLEVDSKKITMPHIKEIGEYKASVHLHRDVNTEITVKVIAAE